MVIKFLTAVKMKFPFKPREQVFNFDENSKNIFANSERCLKITPCNGINAENFHLTLELAVFKLSVLRSKFSSPSDYPTLKCHLINRIYASDWIIYGSYNIISIQWQKNGEGKTETLSNFSNIIFTTKNVPILPFRLGAASVSVNGCLCVCLLCL